MTHQLICGALLIVVATWPLTHLGHAPPAGPDQSRPTKCPDFVVECPPDVVAAGQTAVFEVSGLEHQDRYTYKWRVSAGRIRSGQGTASISVEMPDVRGRSLVVTVEVGDQPAGCAGSASCTMSV